MRVWKPGRIGKAQSDRVYLRLRDDVVSGRHAPGQSLPVPEVAREYDVSRATARDALQRLAVSGLLESGDGDAVVVAEADLEAARDAQLVVAKMHGLAAQLAVGRLDEDDLAAMRDANERFGVAMRHRDVDAALEADVELHEIPVRACGNATVQAVLEQFQPLIVRLERMRFEFWDVEDALVQHAKLVQVCEAGDARAAAVFSEEMWHSLDDATPSQFQRREPNRARRGAPRRNPAQAPELDDLSFDAYAARAQRAAAEAATWRVHGQGTRRSDHQGSPRR